MSCLINIRSYNVKMKIFFIFILLFSFQINAEETGDTENGFGKKTFWSGAYYEGNFKNGKYHGKGIWYNPGNGYYYEGDWVNGKSHGQGIARMPNGEVLIGTWKNHNFVNGTKYTAQEYQALIDKQNEEKELKKRKEAELREKERINKENEMLEIKEKEKLKQLNNDNATKLSNAKLECKEIGFKEKTEAFGECVLELMD